MLGLTNLYVLADQCMDRKFSFTKMRGKPRSLFRARKMSTYVAQMRA